MSNVSVAAVADDLQDHPLFEELQASVRMSASILESGGPNWEKIVRLSRELLKQSSKHLLVAAYYAVGLIHTDGTKGFLSGAHFYLDLIEKEWDALYPPWTRAASRVKAIGWWVDKTVSAMKSHTSLSISVDDGQKLRARLEKANRFLQTHLEGTASLMRIAERVEAAVGVEVSAAPIPGVAPVPTVAVVTNGISSEKEATAILQRVSHEAGRLAAWCASQDLRHPEINRLSRIATRIIQSIQELSYGAENGDHK